MIIPILVIVLSSVGCQKIIAEKERDLSSHEVVDALLKKKQKELYGSSQELKKYEKLYHSYELHLAQIKKALPKYMVSGNLTYAMSLDEMRCHLQMTFKKMYEAGKIISRKDFKKVARSNWYFQKDNLTRIWGAQYLADNFKKASRDDCTVPEYIIVVDDPTNLQVKIAFWQFFPVVARIKGEIYAQYIQGLPAKCSVGFGYTDYTGPNILRTRDGICYVIDTEFRGFYHGVPEKELYRNFPDWKSKIEYLRNRFFLLNRINTKEKIVTLQL